MEKQEATTQDRDDLSNWLSTYGLVTVEKLLERFGIRLSGEDLLRAAKNPECFFFRLIQVPLKNVFNGLILQQAKDYQVYAQKLFIDYLLSGEASQEGSSVRDDLENTRKDLVALGEVFHEEDLANDRLIARSQALLFKAAQLFNKQVLVSAKKVKQALQHTGLIIHDETLVVKSLYTLLCDYDSKTRLPTQHEAWLRVGRVIGQSFDLSLCQQLRDELERLSQINPETETKLQEFREQAVTSNGNIKKFRADFSATIAKTNEMLAMVGSYRLDVGQLATNQHDLYFDAKIGEERE
ncbi:MAG: hypothetical protein A3F46_09070 [Legionellales bacterium RIFCSPHIGHO2_12_FULL_42_9]|nr:MAG: hypothetical protein A3F46_09070 [Legionellales bacterium RIFCSPHIGHO2_12_FULL_42_9]